MMKTTESEFRKLLSEFKNNPPEDIQKNLYTLSFPFKFQTHVYRSLFTKGMPDDELSDDGKPVFLDEIPDLFMFFFKKGKIAISAELGEKNREQAEFFVQVRFHMGNPNLLIAESMNTFSLKMSNSKYDEFVCFETRYNCLNPDEKNSERFRHAVGFMELATGILEEGNEELSEQE
jgi:hypothetical protein